MTGRFLSVAEDCMNRLDPDPDHARQVCRLALRLYDQLAPFSGVFDAEQQTGMFLSARDLLKLGAMLHDIGWSDAGPGGHHKKSRDMILQTDFVDLDPSDQKHIALIARYHRKNHPDPLIHKDFGALDPHNRDRIRWLAAFLRIADGLDRAHRSEACDVDCRPDDTSIVIRVLCDPSSRVSVLYGGNLKAGLLEEVSGKTVTLVAIGGHDTGNLSGRS